MAGFSCGILFNGGETGEETSSDGVGVDLYGFTLCTSGPPCPSFGECPNLDYSGAAMWITWDASVDCQRGIIGADGVHCTAAVFYVYAYNDDIFEITPNYGLISTPAEFELRDCNNQLTDLPYPEAAGAVAFGTGAGRNPCQPSPVHHTSWSRIKTTYK